MVHYNSATHEKLVHNIVFLFALALRYVVDTQDDIRLLIYQDLFNTGDPLARDITTAIEQYFPDIQLAQSAESMNRALIELTNDYTAQQAIVSYLRDASRPLGWNNKGCNKVMKFLHFWAEIMYRKLHRILTTRKILTMFILPDLCNLVVDYLT